MIYFLGTVKFISFDLNVRTNVSREIMIQRNSFPTPMMPPILVSRVRLPWIIIIAFFPDYYYYELADG